MSLSLKIISACVVIAVVAIAVTSTLKSRAFERKVDAQIHRLADPDFDVQDEAKEALLQMCPEAIHPLIQSFARYGKVDFKGLTREEFLEQRMRLPPEIVAVMQFLAHEAGLNAVNPLFDALEDKDQTVRHYATMALAHLRLHAVPRVMEMLENPDYKRRTSGALILSLMGAEARIAIPALEKALQDSEKDVRYTARYALVEIKRKIEFEEEDLEIERERARKTQAAREAQRKAKMK